MNTLEMNPFVVQTPEDMSAEEAYYLFVDVFTDFFRVKHPGHTFIHGHRGSGKSMMFRYMQPDCQCLDTGRPLEQIDFFGAYVPIKNTNPKLTELSGLVNQHANVLLNEHFLCIYTAANIFAALTKAEYTFSDAQFGELQAFIKDDFFRLLEECGYDGELAGHTCTSPADCISFIANTCSLLYSQVIAYLKRIFIETPVPVYRGPLCGYLDFLLPLLRKLKGLSFMPSGPIYLLIDDADNLSFLQTMILNSWVSSRTSTDVSLKISTQLNYKTQRTVTGQIIETPHDYQEVYISAVYTSFRSRYPDRIRAIVEKRLSRAGIATPPERFFPPDVYQEEKIKEIEQQLRADWPETGRGNRPIDDVVRYARPQYIASLHGPQKSGMTYNYAGFDQLIHISSGLIRYFLDAASIMYDHELSLSEKDNQVQFIRPSVQNKVVRDQADLLMFSEFEKMKEEDKGEDERRTNIQKLGNLVNALGGTFKMVLLSNRSERRVFSFALSDTPDDEVVTILRLGVEYGYFHLSAIGNKDGTGRTRLYVLTRRLAPHFSLDPFGFAGYLFVKSDAIKDAMNNPAKMLRSIKSLGLDAYMEQSQLSLFE